MKIFELLSGLTEADLATDPNLGAIGPPMGAGTPPAGGAIAPQMDASPTILRGASGAMAPQGGAGAIPASQNTNSDINLRARLSAEADAKSRAAAVTTPEPAATAAPTAQTGGGISNFLASKVGNAMTSTIKP